MLLPHKYTCVASPIKNERHGHERRVTLLHCRAKTGESKQASALTFEYRDSQIYAIESVYRNLSIPVFTIL
jgi:hypothetical protein